MISYKWKLYAQNNPFLIFLTSHRFIMDTVGVTWNTKNGAPALDRGSATWSRRDLCDGASQSHWWRYGVYPTRGTLKARPNDCNMPTQHVTTLLGATCCVRLATVLRRVAKCWELLAQGNLRNTCCNVLQHVGCCWLKFPWANNTQHVATRLNTVAKRTQHVAPNNVATCCVGKLQSFGRGLI